MKFTVVAGGASAADGAAAASFAVVTTGAALTDATSVDAAALEFAVGSCGAGDAAGDEGVGIASFTLRSAVPGSNCLAPAPARR